MHFCLFSLKELESMFEKRATKIVIDTSESAGGGFTVEEVVQAFVELTTNPDKPADDDFAKILILDAFEFAKEKWRTGLTAPVVVEMLIGRKLTEEEEDYVFLHTEPPTSRLKPRSPSRA